MKIIRKKQTYLKITLSLISLAILSLAPANIYGKKQYKRITKDAISLMVDGQLDEAINGLENYLSQHPNDLESLYGLTVAYAQKNDIDKAFAYMKQAVDGGLSFGRFLAGPRDLLKPLTDSTEFQKFSKKSDIQLLHGPLLGCVTDTTAKFWIRTANEVTLQIIASASEKMSSPVKSNVVKTNSNKDFSAVAWVSNLKPDTKYYYKLIIDGNLQPNQWSFKTFPAKNSKAKFQIGFGGGAGYTPKHERMWNTVISNNLLAFLFLGDNVYIDNPTRPGVQQYCYYRRQSRSEFRDFTAATAIYAIWDDHDFGTNDCWYGAEIDKPKWKLDVWRLFKNNWNNPSYGGGEKQPGCWFNFSIGDVDFFMLDGRFYRTDPKSKNPSMLGIAQKKWLFEKLKSSKATFKVLASPVPWSFNTKPGSLDPWQGYKQEREKIFSFLEENKIDGVILISADRHRSDVWKIERPRGYDLYEFESSRLTNTHTHKIMAGALFGYNEKCSFGLLDFDTTIADPTVTYKIINIDNEVVYKLSLNKSRLTGKKQGNGSESRK